MRAEIDGAPVKYAGWDAYCDACGRGESEEGNESSDGEEEEVDPGPWQDKDPWVARSEPTPPKAKLHIAHKFMTDLGWEVGKIVGRSRGVWAVKYPTDR